MQALTPESIVALAGKLEVYPHNTTIATIQHLLYPYVAQLDRLSSIEQITQWVENISQGDVAEDIGEILIIIPLCNSGIEEIRTIITKVIIRQLLKSARDEAEAVDDAWILPWDIIQAINDKSFSLSDFFRVNSDNEIPIVIRYGAQLESYIEEANVDFTCGLAAFLSIYQGGINIVLSIYGTNFDLAYIQNPNITRYHYDVKNKDKFSFILSNNVQYSFDDWDFLSGFKAGAEIAGVNHHNYWQELVQISKSGVEFLDF